MFCKVCGTKLSEKDKKKCPECGEIFKSSFYKNVHYHCDMCGSELKNGAKICPNCYVRVNENERPKVEDMVTYQLIKKIDTKEIEEITSNQVHLVQEEEKIESEEDNACVKDLPSKEYFWWGIFAPVIGLVLYLVWKYDCPNRAKSALDGAKYGFIISIVLYLVIQLVQCSIIQTK